MQKWMIAVAILLGLLVAWLLVSQRPPETEKVADLPPVTTSGLATPPMEYGDAPECDARYPGSCVLYSGFNVQPRFPTVANFEGDDWYISHSAPYTEVFLGEVASLKDAPLVVDKDDDDGLLTRTLAACQTQGVELLVTIPKNATPGTPLYLNALFDWTRNGAWAGSSDRCGFAVPEWGIRNLRLDRAPYSLTQPGIYRIIVPVTAGAGANVWARFTVTTVPVPVNAETGEWNGQGQFTAGETEDWIVAVAVNQRALGLPPGVPPPPVVSPPGEGPQPATPGPAVKKTRDPLPDNEREEKSKDIQKGNNGVGNGIDPQPPGNPPVNDDVGTGPGNPGNKGGPVR